MSISWALLWSQESFWNPAYFTGMWVGVTLVMHAGGEGGYPGLRRHALLIVLSMPLWWWFEVVNVRVSNWEYLGGEQYAWLPYFLLGSLAFSTVVPALDAAWGLFLRKLRPPPVALPRASRGWYVGEMALGAALQGMVFLLPEVFFPFVWVAPSLILDGLVGSAGGRSLAHELLQGQWRLAAAVALGGLLCGVLWEFWNFWATPKWEYHIPWAEFAHLFEMPVLGYAGYIPFAWSIYQLLHLRPLRRLLS